MVKSSRPISKDVGAQSQEIPLQSQGTWFKQPEPVQTIAQVKMMFRNFVNWDTQNKIDHIKEEIEVSSKMINTKQDMYTRYLQELNQINKMMRKCSAK